MNPQALLPVILGSVLCAICGQVSFKTATNNAGARADGWVAFAKRALPALLVGLLLYASSMLLWIFALARVELSFAFPFVSLSYVGILLAGRFRLAETMHPSRIWGAALIVGGVVLVSLSS
jgi:drug/metabolite transporter (DMT)-like permease